MKGKVYKKLVSACTAVLLLSCGIGSIAQAEESISFTPISSIKIGEELAGKPQYQNASEGMSPTIGFSKEDGNSFWLVGSGGPLPVFPSNGSTNLIFQQSELGTFGTTYCSEAIKVGTVQAKCYATYDDCRMKKEPIATYPITIEEPIITTNANETYYVGDKVEFGTKLTNVALKEGNIEELKAVANPNITGFFTYQAQTEIIEGQNLVVSENADYSNALNSVEELSFIGEGNIKIKITYIPVGLWCGLTDEDSRDLSKEIYIPEKVVTIHVTDTKKTLNDEISNIMNQNLEQDKYTVESWNVFCSALENAKAVLDSDSATNEERINAYEALTMARDGLKLKEPQPSDSTEEPSIQPQNPSGNNSDTKNSVTKVNSEKKEEIPKTGDSNGIILLTILVLGSLVAIGTIGISKRIR